MTKKILGLIPARGGSKGFPDKNIANLNGKPLIGYTIEASLNSQYITHTVVSSDSSRILDVAAQSGATTLIRPAEYASDTASSDSVVSHALDALSTLFDVVVLLQPTSPLRTSVMIDQAIHQFLNSDATALISVCEVDNKLYKAFSMDEYGYLTGVSNNEFPFMRRQDLPPAYMSNGAIYIVDVKEFLDNPGFYTSKTLSYIMDSNSSLDVDSEEDLNAVLQAMHYVAD